METAITSYLAELSDAFLNPQKRIFVGYLGSALVVAALFYLITVKGSLRARLSALRGIALSSNVWWSASARADYKLFAINQAVMMGLAPRLLSQLTVAVVLFEQCHALFGAPPPAAASVPTWAVIAAFTVTHFLADDLSRYLVHRLLHRSALLWPFHKVHHSAETLTPITVFRTHPVEGVFFALRSVAVQGAVIGGFVFCFGDRVDLATVLGVNVLMFVFNAAGANLRHSHVWISYGPMLERVLMSPAQHQIHHSAAPEHFDRNFGSVLALWDWIGGSLQSAQRTGTIRFGLSEGRGMRDHGLRRLYLAPFREAALVLGRMLGKVASGRRATGKLAGEVARPGRLELPTF